MNDRFKFKFYHHETEKIYEVKAICFEGRPTVTLQYNPVFKVPLDSGVLMQCTGLKDKNGKLIFEGDIVEVTNLKSKYVLNTPVVWEKDICAFMVWGNKAKTYGNYIGALMEEDEDGMVPYAVEVIGNIHNNPELLEGE